MLTYLRIHNLAIVAALELELHGGMTVLTGETGAGKSILIDALGLALGDRAEQTIIRAASDRAEITAAFDSADTPEVGRWLADHDLASSGDLVLRRVLVRDGRSRAFINDSPVSLQTLQEIGELLLDIHGQHAHQSLLRRPQQRRLLDDYGGLRGLSDQVEAIHRQWRDTDRQLTDWRRMTRDRDSRLDLLRYQVGELSRLDLSVGQLQAIEEEHVRRTHTERLRHLAGDLVERLYQADASVHGHLARACADLGSVARLDSRLGEPLALLEEAGIQIAEATASLRDYLRGLDTDPRSLQRLEQRLEEIHDTARKYRIRPEEIPDRLGALTDELAQLERADVALDELAAQEGQLRSDYFAVAERLSTQRQAVARALGTTVSERMQELGMRGGRFVVAVTPRPEGTPNAAGLEEVEFLVTANPGMPPQPLAKVASGGELSRISLALQVITAQCGQVPTLIFDEVDVGIGGGVAEIVGRLLRTLGRTHQVLCVTHLPQVAAVGNHHLKIDKLSDGASTRTTITTLADQSRIDEVARMLGGLQITAQTRAHAQEMIAMAQSLGDQSVSGSVSFTRHAGLPQ
jgi:DNA repair protein RecN (Recombination protein N)